MKNNRTFVEYFISFVKLVSHFVISLFVSVGLWVWFVLIGVQGVALVVWTIFTVLLVSLIIYNEVFNFHYERNNEKFYNQIVGQISVKKGLVFAGILLLICILFAILYTLISTC